MASSRRAGGNETIYDYEGSSPDYYEGELNDFETDTDVDQGNGTAVLEVYSEGASGALWDDGNVTFDGATSTDIPRIVRPASGHMHSGIPVDDGSCAGFDVTAANNFHIINVLEDDTHIQDMVGLRSGGTNQDYYRFWRGTSSNYFIGCMAYDTACRGFQNGNLINCLAHNVDMGYGCYVNGFVYNFTENGSVTYALYINSGVTLTSKNCIWDETVTNNGTHNETTNTNSTPTYKNSGSNDFHLDSADTVAIDNGTDLSSDGTFAFDDDIDGDTRSGDWDIGFDEVAAAAGISIDVYDSPTVAEDIGPASPLAGISKFDTVELQEVIDSLTNLFGNTSYDQINVTEFVDAIMHLVAEAGDDVDITEVIQSVMSDGYTSVAQDIEVSEDITLAKPYPASASQDIEIAENIESAMSDGVLDTAQDVEVSEDITSVLSDPPAETSDDLEVSEDITSVMDAKTEPYQSVTVNEYVEMLLQIAGQANINVNDLINVVENIQSKMSGLITDKHDQVVLTEVIALSLVIEISKFDTVQISEYLLGRMSGLPASPYEDIEVSENIEGQVPLAGVDKADTLTLQEYISVALPQIINPSVDDDIEVSEAITSRMSGAAISLAQIIEVVESVEAQVRLGVIDESDNIEIAETILTKMGAAILSAYEQINISEYPYGRMADMEPSLFQSVAITEAITAQVGVPVYLTSIAFALAQRQTTFSLAQRSAAFAVKTRSMTFSLN